MANYFLVYDKNKLLFPKIEIDNETSTPNDNIKLMIKEIISKIKHI